MATTKLILGRDVQGYNSYAPYPSNTNYSATLAASTAESFIVPSDANTYVLIFSNPGLDLWVSTTTTATAPAGATFALTSCMLNPASIEVNKGTVVSCLTDTTGGGDVGVRIYANS
jgi:hypothetical protein